MQRAFSYSERQPEPLLRGDPIPFRQMANDGDHILLGKGDQEGPKGRRDMQTRCILILEPIVRWARCGGDLPGQQAQNHIGTDSVIDIGAQHQRWTTLDSGDAGEIGYDHITRMHRQG